MASRVRKMKRMYPFDYFLYALMVLMTAAWLYPLILTLSISLSDGTDPLLRVTFFPVDFNIQSYLFIFQDGRIFRYYFNTIGYALGSVVVHLLFTSMMAFPFVVKDFRGKTFLNVYLVITMFFGGGLLPSFFINRALGMIDNPLVMILPGAVSGFAVILFRTFFGNIPTELRESAYMDGAGHYRTLFQIILPVSKAVLATFALMNIVGTWNAWFPPMLYFRNPNLMPIQIYLRRMLILFDFSDAQNVDLRAMHTLVTNRTLRSAAVIVTIFPVLCIYPFMQKHFTKGMMLGSVKG
ncbi:MAG: carbohydrate ABC transporter permease [Defluviitaleaceae bacterium]|nr:carbohydrate ABC transporter permease [Defluviitaleaceae bacterium]